MSTATRKQAKRVTISDVAKEAGVSIAAVSRILNNSYDGFSAREETKQRVYAAVKKLGYRPSRAAVRLATGRHNAVGLCYPVYDSLEGPIDTGSLAQVFRHFDLMLVQHGIARALNDQNMDLVVMPRHANRPIPDLISQAQETVDGIIWINPEEEVEGLDTVVQSGLKISIVGPAPLSGDFVNVRTDETLAGRMAMGHLIVCGARKVLVAIPEHKRHEQATVERLDGIRKAMKDFSGPAVEFDALYVTSNKTKAVDKIRAHIEKKFQPEGVLTLGDHLPFAALTALGELNYRVPEQVKIVGFEENLTFLLSTPTISGLRYPVEEMCYRATNMLLDYIKSGKPPKPVYMTPQLIARSSCA